MHRIPNSVLLLGPLLLLLVLAYLLPFAGIVRWSVTRPEPGLDQYRTVLSDPLILSVFWRTLRICTIVTVVSVLAGYVAALLWVRGSRLMRSLIGLCIIVPFWISVLTRAFGWLALLSNRGLINGWLQSIGLISEPLLLVRNEIGVVIGMVHFLIPFAVFPLATAMRNIDERTLMAARGMGARPTRIFWQVFVPMTAAGIMGASLLVFVFSIGFFVTPAILGGGRSVMVAELIYLRIFQSPDWGLAAAISVVLMVSIGALLALLLRQLQPAENQMTDARPGVTAIVLAILVAIFLIMPLLAVVPVSFTPKRFLSIPTDELSLRHYRALIENPAWASGIWLSIRIGLLSAIVATGMGTMFSLGIWMLKPRFAGMLMGIALLPMVAPPVVSALTLYFFLITVGQFNSVIAYDTLSGVALAHSIMISPFAVVMISVSLAQVDRRIDLAARSMGAGLFTRIFSVILPNIRFALLITFFLTFVLSWEEIAVTIFITSVDAVTLPRLMWTGLRDNIDPAIAAISVILIVIVAAAVIGKSAVDACRNGSEKDIEK